MKRNMRKRNHERPFFCQQDAIGTTNQNITRTVDNKIQNAKKFAKESFKSNIHYDMTYDIAFHECRYNEKIAHFIAEQCNNVDTDPNTTPFSIHPQNQGWHFNCFSQDTWENWGTENDSRWKHVLVCIDDLIPKNGPPLDEQLRQHKFKKDPINTYTKVAQGLHALQDMFAHLPTLVYAIKDISLQDIVKDISLQDIDIIAQFLIYKPMYLESNDFFLKKLPQTSNLLQRIMNEESLSPDNLEFLKDQFLQAKFHLSNSPADNIDTFKRKRLVARATNLYLQGELTYLKLLVEKSKTELQQAIQQNNQSSLKP